MTTPSSMTPSAVSTTPQVTIVVVPRERFSCTQASLESIFEHTPQPFNLVYVDGNSPGHIKRYLEAQAQLHQFNLLRTDIYLYPNQARNLGLEQVSTKYVVFVDNDVIVSPGWLDALVQCAEETEATVVGPLMCQYEPLHEEIHFAGGESHVWVDKTGRRRLREKMYDQGHKVVEMSDRLERKETELAEFHCVLVRTEIFDRVGLLDEKMLNTKEHLDFCMTVQQAGGKVFFEPACVVTYVPGPPLDPSDLHYYMLRWSNAWTLASLNRMREKWDLAEDGYFKNKYKKLGWRRHATIIKPLVHKLTLGKGNNFLGRALSKLEYTLNTYLTDRHARLQQQFQMRSPQPSPTTQSAESATPTLSKTA